MPIQKRELLVSLLFFFFKINILPTHIIKQKKKKKKKNQTNKSSHKLRLIVMFRKADFTVVTLREFSELSDHSCFRPMMS